MALRGGIQGREYDKFKLDKNSDTSVRTCDIGAQDILNEILISLGGTALCECFFEDFQGTTISGSTITAITRIVAVGKTDRITRVQISCRRDIQYEVLINASVVGSGRTSPGESNSFFDFNPARPAVAGDTIKLEITQTSGPASDVEVYLMGNEF